VLGDGVCGYADLAGRADRCLIVEDFGLYWSAPSDLNKHLAALSAALRRSARHARPPRNALGDPGCSTKSRITRGRIDTRMPVEGGAHLVDGPQ
jgi:hypothetical protein